MICRSWLLHPYYQGASSLFQETHHRRFQWLFLHSLIGAYEVSPQEKRGKCYTNSHQSQACERHFHVGCYDERYFDNDVRRILLQEQLTPWNLKDATTREGAKTVWDCLVIFSTSCTENICQSLGQFYHPMCLWHIHSLHGLPPVPWTPPKQMHSEP